MYRQRNDLDWQKANNHQLNPKQLDITPCLGNDFGQYSGRSMATISAKALLTSENQGLKPASSPATRFALSPLRGFPDMAVP
jgi:hypothetical protein